MDHHLFQDPAGLWHLWGCVRNTAVGRILYHWKSADIHASPWQATGEIIRADRLAGESPDESTGGSVKTGADYEWMHSPFIVRSEGTFFMFYGGGHVAEDDPERRGSDPGSFLNVRQICLMTSPDGVHWTRRRDAGGRSRVFVGPGPARDPCLVRVDGRWHLYYAGSRHGDVRQPVMWARISDDLVRWSDPVCVHHDLTYASDPNATECPFVTFHDGYWYLLRTERYYEARTHVFRSENPLDFGLGDASGRYVGTLPVAAPELYTIDGQDYVSSNHDPLLGTQMCRLEWVRA